MHACMAYSRDVFSLFLRPSKINEIQNHMRSYSTVVSFMLNLFVFQLTGSSYDAKSQRNTAALYFEWSDLFWANKKAFPVHYNEIHLQLLSLRWSAFHVSNAYILISKRTKSLYFPHIPMLQFMSIFAETNITSGRCPYALSLISQHFILLQ